MEHISSGQHGIPLFTGAMLRRCRGDGSYFFDGQGAPQGAQAPAKSSGETARPLDGLVRWLPTIAAIPITTTMM
jgi:hypothetical protein